MQILPDQPFFHGVLKMRFICHDDPDNDCISLTQDVYVEKHKRTGLIGINASILYVIEAGSSEEASAIHNLRQGWGPYKPMGKAEPCPTCGAMYYPEGSGDCWSCNAEKEKIVEIRVAKHPFVDSWDAYEDGKPFVCAFPFCNCSPEDPIHEDPGEHEFSPHPMDETRCRDCGHAH